MIKISIPTVIDFEKISKDFIKANDAAMLVAAAKGIGPLRAALPVGKTGELTSQVGIRVFKQRNKLRGASLKVIGPRYKVSAILEKGTKDGRIKARRTFDKVAAQISSLLASTYEQVFFSTLESLSGK